MAKHSNDITLVEKMADILNKDKTSVENALEDLTGHDYSEEGMTCMEGFMFDEDFIDSKQFQRYIDKYENAVKKMLERRMFVPSDPKCFIQCGLGAYLVELQEQLDKSDSDYPNELMMSSMFADWILPLPVHSVLMHDGGESVIELAIRYLGTDYCYNSMYDNAKRFVLQQYLYKMSKLKPERRLTRENFVIQGEPTADECLVFIHEVMNYMFSFLVAVGKDFAQSGVDKGLDEIKHKKQIKSMQRTISRNAETIDRYKNQLQQEKSTTKQLQSRVDYLERQIRSVDVAELDRIRQQNEEEQTDLRRQIRDLEEDKMKIQGKYDRLKERVAILEAEAEYDGEDEVGYDNSGLTQESKFLFICEKAPNSKIQRTYDTILAAFPNSKIMYETPTMTHNYDAVVLMVKYLFHHASYWSTRDWCKAHRIPCLHCDKQGIDLIIDDVINRRRYAQTQSRKDTD